ncbi:cytidine deaminase [Fulvivirgaceae bacterium BMA12]|uniref:Cytidine deaminase n=1 Tax=Agaribacillus aureus TaxID=3051825 RepID=A0ABT8L417_9BACT|nr:cytidine deaminase [Fulvivirgaceae bacterium BMA12]
MAKILELKIDIEVAESMDDLDPQWQRLIREAGESINGAYAPYSNFYVGAAVLLNNNIIVTGNNQENAAYPAGMCAERVALFSAAAQYPAYPVERIAIVARKNNSQEFLPASPCGSCRQVMSEYETRSKNPIQVLIFAPDKNMYIIKGIDSLLPIKFSKNDLP